ncbi:hypothetical protein [Bdellovibrio bacteriovorus]|uniref:Uncharacterized protein n=1 Tax=Bdellovibrio bacteriovorus TaxID=959 RepID=A0A1Z3NDI0_BDEBC|nr:hypothetical protein [Bdellovibrio bacteriovorus]ASD65512.1 hypothetical protein B9G79_12440 [Bdellovibrio bacteriovorus]
MKYRIFLSAFLFVLLPAFAQAEYRVFLLKITKKTAAPQAQQPETQDFRLVESTLDHVQYRYYYPVAADEEVTYIDTWRCYGRTSDFQPHCPNPKGQIPAEPAPAP